MFCGTARLRDLKDGPGAHNLVLQAATVAALRDAVEAGFCQAFLPVSMASNLTRAPLSLTRPTLRLAFCLISGPRLAANIAEGVTRKFLKAL